MTEGIMYEVKSCIREWFEEAVQSQGGVPCVQVEAQETDREKAISLAKKLAAKRPDEMIEVRQYPGDTCVWTCSD